MSRSILRARWLATALAVAVPVALIPLGGAGAAAPPTIPPGYIPLVDDTGTITVTVPPTWIDVDTAPLVLEGGAQLPQILAATDITAFVETFDAPGVRFLAASFTPDPQSLINDVGLTTTAPTICTSLAVQPYDDGLFTGLVEVGTGCGEAGQATWNMVVASPADSSFTAVLQVQAASPADAQDMAIVLATFNAASGAPAPTAVPLPTVAGTPTVAPVPTLAAVPTLAPVPTVAVATVPLPTVAVPTVAVPTVAMPTVAVPTVAVPTVAVPTVAPVPTVAGAPTVAPGPTVAGQTLTYTDDTGVLTVQVPATWTQAETTPADGNPFIIVSPDLATLVSPDPAVALTTQGLIYLGTPYNPDTAEVISSVSDRLGEGCTPNPVEPYDDSVFIGSMQIFDSCGGTATFKWVIVANPPSQSHTVLLVIQLQSPDDPALATILGSFDVIS